MEEMKKAAIACYKKADANTQQIVKEFFNSLDKDGNGKITQDEFLEALKQLGFYESEEKQLANLFEKLDTNRDKHLDFNEAVAFYYVTKHTPAVFCCSCCALLSGVYFSCLDCHMKTDGKTYDVCVDCYRNGKSDDHMHKTLYDNHHLLQLYRKLRADHEEEATNIEVKLRDVVHVDEETAQLANIARASSKGKRGLAKLVPKMFRVSADPDNSADKGTATGTGNAVAGSTTGLVDAGGIGRAGVGGAKRGLSTLAERGANGVSHAADAIADACSIM